MFALPHGHQLRGSGLPLSHIQGRSTCPLRQVSPASWWPITRVRPSPPSPTRTVNLSSTTGESCLMVTRYEGQDFPSLTYQDGQPVLYDRWVLPGQISCYLWRQLNTSTARYFCWEAKLIWRIYWHMHLKVMTNEKRGGLKVVSFERSPFKLFTLRFSNKSVQAPSCERSKTAPRTLFLLFANNNCIPVSAYCRAAAQFSHRTLICNNGIVHLPRYLRRR